MPYTSHCNTMEKLSVLKSNSGVLVRRMECPLNGYRYGSKEQKYMQSSG